MPDVAEVYEKKLAAIDADQGEMYTAGYETTAQNIRSEYILTLQAFGEIYRAYTCYNPDNLKRFRDVLENEILLEMTVKDAIMGERN